MTEQEHRKLDARVAMEVMGWVDVQAMPITETLVGRPTEGALGGKVPRYSSRIEDAWQVVERLQAEGHYIGLALRDGDEWVCELLKGHHGSGVAYSAPEAICRAALAWAEWRARSE